METKKYHYIRFVFIISLILFVLSYIYSGIPETNAYSVLTDAFDVTMADVDAGLYTPDFTGYSGGTYTVQDFKSPPHNPRDYITPGYGGQPFEIEFGSFAYDDSYAYFGFVTGMQPSGSWDPWRDNTLYEMGDIFIDLSNDGVWDYAIRISDTSCQVFNEISTTIPPTFFVAQSDPFRVNDATLLYDTSSGDYSYDIYTTDPDTYEAIKYLYSNPVETYDLYQHYALEARIDLDVFGATNPFEDDSYMMHLTVGCGNDIILLKGVGDPPAVPEPSTLFLLASGLFGLVGIDIRRKSKVKNE